MAAADRLDVCRRIFRHCSVCSGGGILQGTGMLVYILIGWLFKTGVEVVCLPITYRVIAKMKQIENIDTYDNKTDFTPFRVDLD